MKAASENQRLKLLNNANAIMQKSEKVFQPSDYWNEIGQKDNQLFLADGFEKMKIRQGLDYSQFLVFEWSYWQFQYVWKRSSIITKLHAILPALLSKPFKNFPMENRQRWLFIYYHVLYWEYIKKFDKKNLLRLNEPKLGFPLLINWKGKIFNQDLLNSITESYSIQEALEKENIQPKTILEVGGGYGRNMFIMKHLFPKAKIIMVDIPPAIILAEWYLKNIFPKSRILKLQDHKKTSFPKEFEKADFIFLLPHQIELIPDKSIDLFININSFQEMTMKQIKVYFKEINRTTKGILYIKQWKKQINKIDKLKINENQYPVYKSWKKIFHREAPVMSKFFEAAYKI